MPTPLQAPTVEVQREEYGAVEVESVLTVGMSNQRMTVECVAFNLVGISSDTFAMEVSGERPVFVAPRSLSHMDENQRKFNFMGLTKNSLYLGEEMKNLTDLIKSFYFQIYCDSIKLPETSG